MTTVIKNSLETQRREESPALRMDDISAGYPGAPVLRDVSVAVAASSIVALLGPNGAGKTTLMRAAAGTVHLSNGRVSIAGEDVTRAHPYQRSRAGLCLIPEGRGIFGNLTVRENLILFLPPWAEDDRTIEKALAAFPEIGRRLNQTAGTMSGGEQQMLALCRAWIAEPSVVLLDEVSMGLAPKIIDKIFGRIQQLASEGVALLIVEQYVRRALDIADHVYLLDKGGIRASAAPDELDQEALVSGYFGGTV